MNNPTDDYNWFPNTFLYQQERKFDFFEKITSRKHFEKIKIIFDVSNENELKDKLEFIKESSSERMSYGRGGFNRIPFVHELIKPETIAIYR